MTLARLLKLRDGIVQVDREMVRLLNKRAGLSLEIGKIKAKLGRAVYDPSQEQRIYENLAENNEGSLPLKSLQAIFREIISASRVLQSPVTVAYLGPEGTYAHLAAQCQFGSSSQFSSQTSIARVFEEVEKGKVNWGVVPVENSVEGSVNLTLDRLITTTLSIRAEILLPIHHCLLSKQGGMSGIKKVYSHPQALAQCQEWLRFNIPRAVPVAVESTSAAAKKAVEEEGAAAIGSKSASEIYGLAVLAEGIEDKSSNTTRFLVVGEGSGEATGNDKTSLLFGAPDTPGALCRILQTFADRGINMMKIESYPVKDRLWEYLFFVDITGHVQDAKIRESLDDLRQKTTFLKILGSYPRSEAIK